MQRSALSDFTFKDRLLIPAGTSIVIPNRLHGHDPDVYPNGDKFDAKRWKRIRDARDAAKFHFASDMLPWSSGPHTCTRRFLTQEALKLIFINLLMKHDAKYSEKLDSHPPNHVEHTSVVPNLTTVLLFRARQGCQYLF